MPLRHTLAALGLGLVLTLPAVAGPEFWRHEWPDTDFETTNVESWVEILSGGPPKDGIPALNDPSFIPAADERRIGAREPVVTLEVHGHPARAYPVRYLTWHEIVNDTVGDLPVAITFCPLCNSFPAFDRRVGDAVLDFGVTGKLRNSDMVMFDRQTESWWQQAIGTGIVGDYTGAELTRVPVWMESWAEFRARNPEGLVMEQPAYPRRYGTNPYTGYDSSHRPFLYSGEMPPHGIPALARVVQIGNRAWPLERLRRAGKIVQDGLTLTWSEGQASALDFAEINEGRDVGTVRVHDGAGRDVAHDVMFAFAFHAFYPEGTWLLR